jgi:low affinity Fe/Cu permease
MKLWTASPQMLFFNNTWQIKCASDAATIMLMACKLKATGKMITAFAFGSLNRNIKDGQI